MHTVYATLLIPTKLTHNNLTTNMLQKNLSQTKKTIKLIDQSYTNPA